MEEKMNTEEEMKSQQEIEDNYLRSIDDKILRTMTNEKLTKLRLKIIRLDSYHDYICLCFPKGDPESKRLLDKIDIIEKTRANIEKLEEIKKIMNNKLNT